MSKASFLELQKLIASLSYPYSFTISMLCKFNQYNPKCKKKNYNSILSVLEFACDF